MDLKWFRSISSWIRTKVWGDMENSVWTFLPDTVLIEVYSYLGDKDRSNMALACHNWLRAFKTPSLWRKRTIELGGYRALLAGNRACNFAEQYGKYLHHLTISCNHPSNHTCKIVQQNIDDFLDRIVVSHLKTIEFSRLELDRFWKYEHLREKVVSSVSRFLRTQLCIEEFDMSCAQCSLTNGCKLLESLGTSSGHVLKNLGIEDFFHSRLALFQVKRFRNLLKKYTALNDISINYNCLSDDVLDTFSKNLEGKLTRILVKVYKADPHIHRISGHAWKTLRTSCPKLTVEVWFESIGMSTEVINILVPEMPLQDMHMWSGYNDDNEWNLADIIIHITRYYKRTIHSLSLELDNTEEMIDEALVRMLTRCGTLHELTVNATLQIFTVETICEMQRENKISLQLCHLTCCGLTDIEWAELSYLRDKYTPMFKERSLDFKMHSDLLIDT